MAKKKIWKGPSKLNFYFYLEFFNFLEIFFFHLIIFFLRKCLNVFIHPVAICQVHLRHMLVHVNGRTCMRAWDTI
jgi:hypothetical protein